MARISRSSRRARVRSGIRDRRTARANKAGQSASASAIMREKADVPQPETAAVRSKARRSRIKAARAVLKALGQRCGFGQALRAKLRGRRRLSARRARLRAASRQPK